MDKVGVSLEQDPIIPGQKYFLMSYLSPDKISNINYRFFKLKGVYETEEEANKMALYFQGLSDGRYFDILKGDVGKWIALPETEEDKNLIKDQKYYNEQLNELMTHNKNNIETNEKIHKEKIEHDKRESERLQQKQKEKKEKKQMRKLQKKLNKKNISSALLTQPTTQKEQKEDSEDEESDKEEETKNETKQIDNSISQLEMEKKMEEEIKMSLLKQNQEYTELESEILALMK